MDRVARLQHRVVELQQRLPGRPEGGSVVVVVAVRETVDTDDDALPVVDLTLEAVGRVGGHAAGRRVRARDEPHLFEVGHHVADRRGRKLESGLPRQDSRPDRLPVGDVALDQRLQKVLRAGVKHAPYFML